MSFAYQKTGEWAGGGEGGENPFSRPVNQTINYGLSPIPTDANQLKSV